MRYASFVLLVVFIMLVGCASVTVNYDYDSEYDFGVYKTFKFAKMNIPDDALRAAPIVAKRVHESIKTVLEEKGFRFLKDEDADPDFVVVAHAGVKNRMQIHNWNRGGWYDPWWGPYGGHTTVSHYEEGTLVIDIVDMKNKELAWRGLGTKVLGDNKSPEKAEQAIDHIVRRILSNFPPPQK